jgi:hypothetical protein
VAKLAQAKPHAAFIPADTLARWFARARPLLGETALPAAIVLVALFLRVYRMELEAWLPDTYEQLTASRNLVHGVLPPSPIYPPGVAVTMAPAMLLLPQTLATMQAVIVLASLVTIAVCYFGVKEATGDRLAAALLAIGVAIAPRMLYSARTGLYDTISTMWVVGTILLVPALRRRGVVSAALFGVALSIATTVRGSNAAFLPAIAIYWSGIGTTGVSWGGAARTLVDRRAFVAGGAMAATSLLLAITSGWLGHAAGGTPFTAADFGRHLLFYYGTEFEGVPALFVVAPAALVGAIEVWRRNRTLLIVAMYAMAVWPIVHAPMPFFNARYMLPAMVFGLMLAAHAPAALMRELDGARRTPAILAQGAIVVALVFGGLFFAGVDGLILYQWHDLAAESDEAAARELRPIVAGLPDGSLLASTAVRGVRESNSRIQYFDLIDYSIPRDNGPANVDTALDDLQRALDGGHRVYYLHSRVEFTGDTFARRGPGYEVYMQALERRFDVTAVYVAQAPHYVLYEISDRSAPATP